MSLKHRFSLISGIILWSLLSLPAQGFIEREYTIHEILDACTNIIFGKVKSVDTQRLRATVDVKENVKGESGLTEIKINFATGTYTAETSPQKMVNLLKVDMPIIVFYRQSYGIESLGYVDNAWFQTRSYGASPSGWWGFTHIDPYMSRTFNGSTTEFQKVIRAILAGEKWVGIPANAVNILVLTGNSTEPMWSQVPVYTNSVGYEYHAIRSIRKAGARVLAFEATQNRDLPGLDLADLLWIGQGELASQSYLLDKGTEDKIKAFVKKGGIVIVSGQDSDRERPCETGWLVGTLKGIERPPTQDFKVTKLGQKLFSNPNLVLPGQIYIDDAWTEWGQNCAILATSNDGKDLVVGTLRYSKGLYIITSMRNDDQGTVAANKNLIENILHYAAGLVK